MILEKDHEHARNSACTWVPFQPHTRHGSAWFRPAASYQEHDLKEIAELLAFFDF